MLFQVLCAARAMNSSDQGCLPLAAGGFLMNGAQELLTAIEHDLHVTIMVLSACSYLYYHAVLPWASHCGEKAACHGLKMVVDSARGCAYELATH